MNYDLLELLNNVEEMLKYRKDNTDQYNSGIKDVVITNVNTPIILYSDNTCVIFSLTKLSKKYIIDQLKPSKKTKKKEDDDDNDEEDIKENVILEKLNEFVQNHNKFINFIFIFSDLTSTDKKLLNAFDKILQQAGGLLSIFLDKDLYFNPTKHELVDNHRKLNSTESTSLMNKYNIKSKLSLPLILKTDPIAKWLGLKTGDIVEIDRYNTNSGLTKYYRSCV